MSLAWRVMREGWVAGVVAGLAARRRGRRISESRSFMP